MIARRRFLGVAAVAPSLIASRSGFSALAAVSFLKENPKPTEEEVRLALEGNLCRCTSYHNIVKAVLAASGAAT